MAQFGRQNNYVRGVLWALGAAWLGAAFIVPWKLAADHGRPPVIVAVMLGAAALFNTGGVVARWRRLDRRTLTATTWWVSAALGALTVLGNLASAAAISRISGPLLSVILRVEVIVIALLAWAVLEERVDRGFALGAVVAGIGLWVVNQPASEQAADAALDGLLFGLGAAVCFSSMSVIIRRVIADIDPISVNALRLWISFAVAVALHGASFQRSEFNTDLLLYGSAAALFGPALSRLAMMYSARYIEARITALVVLTSPVWALLLCGLFLGTWPQTRELAGGSLMLAGVAMPVVARARAHWLRVRASRNHSEAATSLDAVAFHRGAPKEGRPAPKA